MKNHNTNNNDNNNNEENKSDNSKLLLQQRLVFRRPTKEEIPDCYKIESASYPSDEAATLQSLYYRQNGDAGKYFLCAFLKQQNINNNDNDDNNHNDNDMNNDNVGKTSSLSLIGFVCGTRCHEFHEETMTTHISDGPYLAIHSVVIEKSYRRKGLATKLLQEYISIMMQQNYDSVLQQQQQTQQKQNVPIQSIVLLAKANLLGFYVQCGGFIVVRPSAIVHGAELWYDLERPMIRTTKRLDESWFVYTTTTTTTTTRGGGEEEEEKESSSSLLREGMMEQEHFQWIQKLKYGPNQCCITSGRMYTETDNINNNDNNNNNNSNGEKRRMIILAAQNYQQALELVQQDPLIVNKHVKDGDWEVKEWIGQVGDLHLR